VATNPADVVLGEAPAMRELAALHGDPIYYGRGAPKGDGRPVLVVPGLFGNDAYLHPLRWWLRRIGYSPVRSGLVLNAGCPDRLSRQLDSAVALGSRSTRPVVLVGHSRGGMLCWALASRLQDRVSHLVLLGSPAPAVVAMFRSERSVPIASMARSGVARAGARALALLDPDCTVPACGCAYVDDLRRPLHPGTQVLAVRSREDRIVPPEACVVRAGENVEVGGTHSGLVYNRAVYPHLARFLAAAPVTR
jgi:triacylglycerol lipase